MCSVKKGVLENGRTFITCKYNTMNKSRLRLQNWLTQTCNVFVFTFIKHLFKRRDVLHTGCLVEKQRNHIILIWTIKFNVKQVKQKRLDVCITWEVVGFLEFYIQWELLDLVLPYT